MSKKSKLPKETIDIINEAVTRAIRAERLQGCSNELNPYKMTEKRLYAFPDLSEKVEADKEKLSRLMNGDSDERSKSIVRFSRSGYRFAPEEMLEMMIKDISATIAEDENELEIIRTALASIKNDPYYEVIPQVYFEGKEREEIAEAIPCDVTTVWRNRKRLINRLSVRLYGTLAIR